MFMNTLSHRLWQSFNVNFCSMRSISPLDLKYSIRKYFSPEMTVTAKAIKLPKNFYFIINPNKFSLIWQMVEPYQILYKVSF